MNDLSHPQVPRPIELPMQMHYLQLAHSMSAFSVQVSVIEVRADTVRDSSSCPHFGFSTGTKSRYQTFARGR